MWQNLPLFPPSASTMAGEVDRLYLFAVAISAFFCLLIGVLVIALGLRYKRTHADQIGDRETPPEWLELVWTAIPLAIMILLFVWGTRVFFTLSRPPADAAEYLAVGRQWMWKFQHPQGTREINELHVPAGQPIKLRMTSEDVIHSMFLPAFRVKADVLPGRYTTVWFNATKPGTYHLFCAEYCGAEHSRMMGRVIVMEPADYQAWLAAGGTPAARPVLAGQQLYNALACSTCHQAGDAKRAPNLAGLFGTQVPLLGGGSALADETYLRESILEPSAKVVAGFQPIMPTYKGQLSEEQLYQLITYLKTLEAARVDAPAGEARTQG